MPVKTQTQIVRCLERHCRKDTAAMMLGNYAVLKSRFPESRKWQESVDLFYEIIAAVVKEPALKVTAFLAEHSLVHKDYVELFKLEQSRISLLQNLGRSALGVTTLGIEGTLDMFKSELHTSSKEQQRLRAVYRNRPGSLYAMEAYAAYMHTRILFEDYRALMQPDPLLSRKVVLELIEHGYLSLEAIEGDVCEPLISHPTNMCETLNRVIQQSKAKLLLGDPRGAARGNIIINDLGWYGLYIENTLESSYYYALLYDFKEMQRCIHYLH